MAIDASVFREVGGFDPEFFAYYEDVDLGWRMWVMGHEVQYVPSAVCRHRHSGTSRDFPPETVRLLQTRNPLFCCMKNYERENLVRVLPAALGLAIGRALLVSGLDAKPFRIERFKAERPSALARLAKILTGRKDTVQIRRRGAAELLGINDLLGNWSHWVERREEVQSKRLRPDRDIFELFLKPLWCVEPSHAYQDLHEGLSSMMGIDELFRDLTIPGPDPR
jgi:hypothetical protein